MDQSFHFALLRISIIQILKATGFDKCKPSIVNIITDLYIQYLKLLLLKSLKYSKHRGDAAGVGEEDATDLISVQDIAQAMLDLGFIKPSSGESLVDAYDVPTFPNVKDYNVKSAESFKNWILYSDSFTTLKKITKLPKLLSQNLIEKRKIDNGEEEVEEDKEKKSRRLKEKQDFYNHFTQNLSSKSDPSLSANTNTGSSATAAAAAAANATGVDGVEGLNWLNYISEKDLKLGYDMKFLNTSLDTEFRQLLSNDNLHPIENKEQKLQTHLNNLYKFDHILIEIEEDEEETSASVPTSNSGVTVSLELAKTLPYNLKYDSILLEEPLDEYYEYTQSKIHEKKEKDESKREEEQGGDKDNDEDDVKDEANLNVDLKMEITSN